MMLFAVIVEALFALGLKRPRIVITPILSGLTVFVVGLQLGVVGIRRTLDIQHVELPTFPLHICVTSLTLLACISLSIWGRRTLKLLTALVALIVGMAATLSAGLIAS